MTEHKSFKRLVRARMEKTGESYTATRAQLLAGETTQEGDQPTLATSDDAIRQRTGRGWEEWFDLLDGWGAASDRTERSPAGSPMSSGSSPWRGTRRRSRPATSAPAADAPWASTRMAS